MRKLLFIFMFTYSLICPAQEKDLIIRLGDSQDIAYRGQGGVWIQDGKIVKASPSGRGIQLKGLKEGRTSVRLGSRSFQVQVVHPMKLASFSSLKAVVDKVVGLKLDVLDGDLVVTGRLYQFKNWQALAEQIESEGITYQMRAEMSDTLKTEAARYFRGRLEQAKLPPQTLIFDGSPEIRAAGSEAFFKKYIKILSPFGISVVRDEQSLDIAPTVKVQITVAEVRRSFSEKYGLKWPSSYTATLVPDGSWQGQDMEFNATALESQGQGKILASPNIICRSGKEAEFLAGGEFPVKVFNYKIQDIVWKRYGILLKVKPVADSSGRMSISIDTEVSTIDDSRKVDDIPGILTNHVSSHFDLTKPQTIALSGLLKNEDGKSSDGIPFLSRLPILGALFSSNDFKENRTELIIFVRPSILREGSEDETTVNPNSHLGSLENKQL
jgi:pilus assembly protein CpaC